jgi:hypothetical protein
MVMARIRKRRQAQRQEKQAKSNKENNYVIKVMRLNIRKGGQFLWSARAKGCPNPKSQAFSLQDIDNDNENGHAFSSRVASYCSIYQ